MCKTHFTEMPNNVVQVHEGPLKVLERSVSSGDIHLQEYPFSVIRLERSMGIHLDDIHLFIQTVIFAGIRLDVMPFLEEKVNAMFGLQTLDVNSSRCYEIHERKRSSSTSRRGITKRYPLK